MNISTIGLIAAMPEEIKPFLKRIGSYEKENTAGHDLYRFSAGDKKIVLLCSGMGTRHATAAACTLMEAGNPDIILNFGFAGAVTAGPRVGGLVLAEQIIAYDGTGFTDCATPSVELVDRMQCLAGSSTTGCHIYRGTFITTEKITPKNTIARLLPKYCPYPSVEMETAAVAAAAANAGIPFAAMRAISDAADEELGFSLDEFTDAEMNIRIGKVLATIARKPWIVPQLVRLAKNSRTAGESLARGVEAFIRGI